MVNTHAITIDKFVLVFGKKPSKQISHNNLKAEAILWD